MRNPARSRERGFVLVGVVMFVLALTILALSLYGLSSYEGQFLNDTQSEEQAIMRSEGGIEMVQALISMPPYALSQAKLAEAKEGIAYAKAWQIRNNLPDSTSAINWSDSVFVRVGASVHGIRRDVEGIYVPTQTKSPYKRLFTCPSPIYYNVTDVDGGSRVGSTTLRGSVWQTVINASDSLWTSSVSWPSGRPMDVSPAPTPDLAAFFTQHYATATNQHVYVDSTNNDNELEFDAGSNTAVKFFRSPPKSKYSMGDSRAQYYEFFMRPKVTIRVRGTAIWLMPNGVRFDNQIVIENSGSGTANLIIVTGPNGLHTESGEDYRGVGLWCFGQGRIRADNDVRVFMVSSGMVRLEQFAHASGGGGGGAHGPGGNDPPGGGSGSVYSIEFPLLNIFAQSIWLMGPRNPANMDLTYSSASMNDAVDQLLSVGALPPVPGSAGGAFALKPGSWRQP